MCEDIEVDSLAKLFCELQVSNMATASTTAPQTNLAMLKMYVETVPTFNGDPNALTPYINSCDFLFNTYGHVNDPLIKNYLIRAVLTKLVDRAQILISCRPELNDWPSIKTTLTQCFGDRRNLECLEHDLIMSKPQKNESIIEFGARLQVLRSNLASKICNTTEFDKTTKQIYIRQYEQLSLKTFIRNLPNQLQSIIRLKNPDTLETAMSYVIEEENFSYTSNILKNQNFNKSNHFTQNFRPNLSNTRNFNSFSQQNPSNFNQFRQQNSNQFNQQFQPRPFNQFNPQFRQQPFNPFYRQNSNQFKFPSQPIDIRPREVKRHFPTHSQVFGKPNVFKPSGNTPDVRPTPMSGVSVAKPHDQRPNYSQNNQFPSRNQNYFQPLTRRSNPDFLIREVNQIENENSQDLAYTPNQSEIDPCQQLASRGEENPEIKSNIHENFCQASLQDDWT